MKKVINDWYSNCCHAPLVNEEQLMVGYCSTCLEKCNYVKLKPKYNESIRIEQRKK